MGLTNGHLPFFHSNVRSLPISTSRKVPKPLRMSFIIYTFRWLLYSESNGWVRFTVLFHSSHIKYFKLPGRNEDREEEADSFATSCDTIIREWHSLRLQWYFYGESFWNSFYLFFISLLSMLGLSFGLTFLEQFQQPFDIKPFWQCYQRRKVAVFVRAMELANPKYFSFIPS